MHKLPDDLFSKRLDCAPNPDEAVVELFDRARSVSEDRLFLAVLDLDRIQLGSGGGRTPHLGINYARAWMANQVGELYAMTSTIPDDATEEQEEWIRFLQLVSYSQIWECLAIQRLTWSVVRTAGGKGYNPELLVQDKPRTAFIWNSIRDESREAGLGFADLIEAIYHNLIRNAFAHSDAWISHRAISTAPDVMSRGPTFHVSFDTWDRLFARVGGFLAALFRERKQAEEKLKSHSPRTFSLNEFAGPFTVVYDEDRGNWTFER
ncbi:MAG: hypothetical protein Kow0074_17520 [Candidatus Zixiibacteriota bacterium]